MNEEKCTFVDLQTRIEEESRSALDLLVRRGAQQMLQVALELEVAEYVASRRNVVDVLGRREVVRNGYLPEREVAPAPGG